MDLICKALFAFKAVFINRTSTYFESRKTDQRISKDIQDTSDIFKIKSLSMYTFLPTPDIQSGIISSNYQLQSKNTG